MAVEETKMESDAIGAGKHLRVSSSIFAEARGDDEEEMTTKVLNTPPKGKGKGKGKGKTEK